MAFPLIRIVFGVVAVAAPVIVTLWLACALPDKSMRVMWPQFLAAVLCVAYPGALHPDCGHRRMSRYAHAMTRNEDLQDDELAGAILEGETYPFDVIQSVTGKIGRPLFRRA